MGKILLVVAAFGLLVYGAFWLIERRRARGSRRGSLPRRSAPKRTLGPDDDEDFLRQLEQRRRRAAREQKKKPPKDEGSGQDQPKPE